MYFWTFLFKTKLPESLESIQTSKPKGLVNLPLELEEIVPLLELKFCIRNITF